VDSGQGVKTHKIVNVDTDELICTVPAIDMEPDTYFVTKELAAVLKAMDTSRLSLAELNKIAESL
jgi:hypothetical protein